jgi:general secretion pathway protein F
MAEYNYVARDLAGGQVAGTVSANSERDALQQLSSKSLFPVSLKLTESVQATKARLEGRVPQQTLALAYSQLADLLRSGVPLLRALDLLARQARQASLKAVLEEVRGEVADGSRFAAALAQHPRIFSDLTVSMIRAGEEGSFLEDSLQRIADFAELQEELRGRVLGAMAYPAFLLVVGSIILVVMLVYFVPQFEPLFAEMSNNGQLPTATIVLMSVSNTLQSYWWLLPMVLGGAGYFARNWLMTPAGQKQLDQLWLKTWGVGNVVRSLAIARFCRALGTLLKNGVPLLTSLRIAKDATGNRVLGEAILSASETVSTGQSLAKPLRDSGQFPEEILEMVAVGEEANNLEQVLIQVAERMERQTNRQLDLVVRLLEPMLLLAMASIIMFLVIALMLPIMQSSSVA